MLLALPNRGSELFDLFCFSFVVNLWCEVIVVGYIIVNFVSECRGTAICLKSRWVFSFLFCNVAKVFKLKFKIIIF